MKKRVIAMLLAGVMALSLTACGGGDSDKGKKESGKEMKVAMVTDSGDITDQSFNQTTYESGKAWSEDNDVEFTYYKPESDNDEARKASVDQAVADGANVILLPGYLFASAVIEKSEMYPDVKFVALDVGAGDILGSALGDEYDGNEENYDVKEYYHADNVYCATYQEELSGYMAGYAAVKLGYKHLGFLGGMKVPAVTRFGYGYVQGANEAAKELGITDQVQVEYVCGGQFYGDADITAYMDTWYGTKGVEAVFACGGGIYTSAAEAAGVSPQVCRVRPHGYGLSGSAVPVLQQVRGLSLLLSGSYLLPRSLYGVRKTEETERRSIRIGALFLPFCALYVSSSSRWRP